MSLQIIHSNEIRHCTDMHCNCMGIFFFIIVIGMSTAYGCLHRQIRGDESPLLPLFL